MSLTITTAGPNVSIRSEVAGLTTVETFTPEQAREIAMAIGITANDAEAYRGRMVRGERARDSSFGGLYIGGERL